MSYGNNNNRGPKQEKLWASSAKKWLHFNNETDPQTGQGRKEQGQFEFDVTEEVSFSIKPESVDELLARIQAAAANPAGTGGVRISLYCRRQQSREGGREFDGIGILIYEQKPQQNFQRGGGGGFRGQSRGRTNYPPRQQQAPVQGGYGGYRQGGQPQGQGEYNNAPQDTGQPGPVNPGPQTQGYPQGGRGQPAPQPAYPSNPPQPQQGGYQQRPNANPAPARNAPQPMPGQAAGAGSTAPVGPPVPDDCPI
jgi:hypothetical protein